MPPIIQSGRMPRALRTQGQLRRPPCTKTLSSIYPNQQPHLLLPVCSPHRHWIVSDDLLGAKPTLGRPPTGHSQRDWPRNTGDLLQPSPSARLTLPPPSHSGTSGYCHSFRAGETAGPSEPQVTFEGPPAKTLGPMLPLPSTLTSVCHSAPHRGSDRACRLPGSNTKPRSATKGPFPKFLAPQCWGLGTTEAQCQTHRAARQSPGPIWVPPIIHVRRMGKEIRGLGYF